MADDADSLDLEQLGKDAERLFKEVHEEVKAEVPAKTESQETILKDQETSTEDETLAHEEKSRLGRKVKRLEDTLAQINDSLSFLRERSGKVETYQEPEDPEPELSEYPTADEIKAHHSWSARQIEHKQTSRISEDQAKREKYGKDYIRLLHKTVDADDDPELYRMLTDTKDLTYNTTHGGEAVEDFLINYRNAVSFLRTKSTPSKQLVKGKQAPVVNVPSSTVQVKKTVDTSKWSTEERDLARLFGEEELASLGI